MQHINVENDFVNNLFESDSWGKFGVNVEKGERKPNLSESVEMQEGEEYEEVEQVHEDYETEYACPLCECELDGPLSEEVISEHIDTVMTLVSESLNEAYDEDYDDEEIIDEEYEEVEAD
jgi:DNA repair exonuclease SbcCD ATPase subunit